MQSPAPMQNGASFNFNGNGPLGPNSDMMGPGPGGYGGNFNNNNGPIPPQMGHMMNMPHHQQPPPGQMPPQPQEMMMHQQRGNMMMDPMMQNGPPQNGLQRGPMPPHQNPSSVPSPHPKQPQYPHPGISPLPPNQQPSPHPNQPPYPQPGISPLPNQPPMNMNNPHSRVMSPMSQPGMMSPHHQMMNQGGPPMGIKIKIFLFN